MRGGTAGAPPPGAGGTDRALEGPLTLPPFTTLDGGRADGFGGVLVVAFKLALPVFDAETGGLAPLIDPLSSPGRDSKYLRWLRKVSISW